MRRSQPKQSATSPTAALAVAKPLYIQVEELLIQRLVNGDWEPGEPLPSEPKIAAEYGVHQGTVRRALKEMESKDLLVRLQRKSTFVTNTATRHSAFRFFRIRPRSDGLEEPPLVLPITKFASCSQRPASEIERNKLQIDPDWTDVVRLRRLRLFSGKPVNSEQIVYPVDMFPGLHGLLKQIQPDTNYSLLEEKYRVLIVRVAEHLSAVGASRQESKLLGAEVGSPLLQVERTGFTVDGRPAEWRVSYCLNDAYDYFVEFP